MSVCLLNRISSVMQVFRYSKHKQQTSNFLTFVEWYPILPLMVSCTIITLQFQLKTLHLKNKYIPTPLPHDVKTQQNCKTHFKQEVLLVE